jgi:hypothetical protein
MLASGPQRAYAQQIGPKKRVALVHPSSKVAGMKIVDRTMASRFTSVSLNASVTSKEKISSSNVIQRKVSRSDTASLPEKGRFSS